MSGHLSSLVGQLFDRRVEASWQVAVVVIVVLALELLFSRRVAPRLHYGLWLVVVLRLSLPAVPRDRCCQSRSY